MPRTLKNDRFYFYTPRKSGFRKGKFLVGVNTSYNGSGETTLAHFVAFLKKNKLDINSIILHGGFAHCVKAKTPKKKQPKTSCGK